MSQTYIEYHNNNLCKTDKEHKEEIIEVQHNETVIEPSVDIDAQVNSIDTQSNTPAPDTEQINNLSTNSDVSNHTDVVTNTTVVNSTTKDKVSQTFHEYFLFKLYYNYGVCRRMITDNIALLYYNKIAKGYKPNEHITMLCRHMLLDINNMRIISLGIPKAMNIEEFTKIYNIDMNDATSNITNNSADSDSEGVSVSRDKFSIYKFPEGPMITYNPSLKKINIECINTHKYSDINDETNIEQVEGLLEIKNNIDEINKNIKVQFNKMLQYSTRKIVGTGSFNSTKTFLEMFTENNTIADTNLNNIPDDMLQDIVLVFNIEHPENRIITTDVRNYNTLCGVFKFKTHIQSTKEYDIIKNVNVKETNYELINSGFIQLGMNMVIQIPVTEFMQSLLNANLDIKINIPEVIKSIDNIYIDITGPEHIETIKATNIIDMNITNLMENINKKTNTFQGYIIYGINGERTKITNKKYKELKLLKGNKPIVIEQWNTKNLFNLYWRLISSQSIPKFISEFDADGSLNYRQLFYWFANITRSYAINLFIIYHNSFVKKTFSKYNIPYSMKPLCGDLHNMYKKTKIPITQAIVETFIFGQHGDKIFWRIFSDK